MIVDKAKLKAEAKRVVETMYSNDSYAIVPFGDYCFIKVEGNGPHIRFRSEFPGETIKEADVPVVAAVFAELTARIEAQYAEKLKREAEEQAKKEADEISERSPRRR